MGSKYFTKNLEITTFQPFLGTKLLTVSSDHPVVWFSNLEYLNNINTYLFRSCLHTLDGSLFPPSTWAEICLAHLSANIFPNPTKVWGEILIMIIVDTSFSLQCHRPTHALRLDQQTVYFIGCNCRTLRICSYQWFSSFIYIYIRKKSRKPLLY